MSLPIVVTHPSTLFLDGLRRLFSKSRFRPARIATSLNDELETYLRTQGSCVWLTGVETSLAATNALMRKIVAANPGVKAVILAPAQNPEDVVGALKAGACGFLSQDICGERLLKSLELIAMSQMVVHPQFAWSPANENRAHGCAEGEDRCGVRAGELMLQSLESQSGASCASDEAENGAGQGIPSLSRRET